MIDTRDYPLPAGRRVEHDNSCYHANVAGWRSSAARELAEAVKTAGGAVERAGRMIEQRTGLRLPDTP
jgi:sulfur relay (sulfurtransferase) DsrC/TusE family protein